MNTHNVNSRTIWAVLVMEAGFTLPLISLPTQGDRIAGALGPLLMLALLPLGYVAVRALPALRDPSWRLLTGLGVGLLTRAVVGFVPDPEAGGLAVWLGHSVIPIAIGLALWWRGAALWVAELTAADVRTEFAVLAGCLIGALALIRPFLTSDQVLLGSSVAMFAVGGLVATALSRQDAAALAPLRFGRTLATATALLPALAAVVLVSILRPALLTVMWLTLGRALELLFTPLGLLIAWLASLFPRGGPIDNPPPQLPRMGDNAPDPAALAELQDRLGWLGWVVLVSLLVVGSVAALIIVRMMLQDFIAAPRRAAAGKDDAELTAETSGDPSADAHDFLGWLGRWLRGRLTARRRAPFRGVATSHGTEAEDAWAAYRRLLEWASRQGLGRRPAETTRELQSRIASRAPQAADAIEIVTTTYEWERYGDVHPAAERLASVRKALAALTER